MDNFKPTLDHYKKALEVFLRECRELKSTGLKISCLAGFHPAEVDRLIGMGLKPEEVLELAYKVLDIEEDLCRKGVINGIGEVGRQHYKTMPERFAIAESVMIRAFEIAKDYDCIVHLHLENAGPVTVATIAKLVEYVGIEKSRILFHHASLRVAAAAIERGFHATIPGKYELLRKAVSELTPSFMVESDFIDDPRRPCVSSCPWEIIDNQIKLLKEGVISEEFLARINVDNVVSYYGVTPP
jgi:TatD-related deoxyribonuclease